MSNPMNIWMVSLFEPAPVDQTRPMRFQGIIESAKNRGHNITHFSSTFRHPTKKERFTEYTQTKLADNYLVEYVYATPYQKNISVDRIKSNKTYTKNLKELIATKEKPDLILVNLPPLSPAEMLTAYGKEHNIPVIVDIIDPWPDVFLRIVPKGLKGIAKLGLSPVYGQLKNILNNCSGLVAISDEYVQWAKGFGINIPQTDTFLPAILYKEVAEKMDKIVVDRNEDEIRVVYAGNLGLSYDIPCILDAAELLEKELPGKSKFIIAGSGDHVSKIEEYKKKYNNVEYLGRIEHDELLRQYANADLGLAQYSKGATQSITYKFFDYLGAGLPILNSLMTEMARLTEAKNVGFNNEPGDHVKLAENIKRFINDKALLKQYKHNAIEYTKVDGDSEVVYDRYVQFMEALPPKQHS